MAGKYPSHRYHPSLGFDAATGTAEYVVVNNEQEDAELEAQDELWSDTPYTEDEHAEWKAANPKKKKVSRPAPRAAAANDDDEGDAPEAPKREDFPSGAQGTKEFKAALKKFEEENG